MSKLFTQINKYLITIFFVLFFIAIVVAGAIYFDNGIKKTSKLFADTDADTVGYWTDHVEEILPNSSGEYEITTAGQFAWACKVLNDSTTALTYQGKSFKIMNYIDFSAYYWVPIGSGANSDSCVSASFVADDSMFQEIKILSGIKIDNRGTNFPYAGANFGLFGKIDNCTLDKQGTLSKIQIKDIQIIIDIDKVAENTINIGALAGYYAGRPSSSTSTTKQGVANCGATGKITIIQNSMDTTKTINIGGLIGQTGKIADSTSSGSLVYNISSSEIANEVEIDITGSPSSTYYVGGLVGKNAGTITSVENNNYSAKVYNTAKISSNTGIIGGIVGQNMDGANIENIISGQNSDADTGSGFINERVGTDTNSIWTVGGIVGENLGTIKNCQNYMPVCGYQNLLGGIVGKNYGTVDSCVNRGRVYVDPYYIPPYSEKPKYALNDATTFNDGLYLGGIAGQNLVNGTAGLIKNCQNRGYVNGQNVTYKGGAIGGIVGANAVNSTINTCKNYATIGEGLLALYVGGIAGINDGKITATATKSSDFTANFGTIAHSIFSAGGIVGGAQNIGSTQSMGTFLIENCYNVGNINITNLTQDGYVGGIIGKIINMTGSQIKNCINLGDLSTFSSAGGIVGHTSSQITIENCGNYAQNLSAVVYVGGIVGETSNTITLNYVLSTSTITKNSTDTKAGGIVGRVEDKTIELDFSKSAFDLGVAGYGLSNGNGVTMVSSVGTGGAVTGFQLQSSPLTYYMTSPGVKDSVSTYTIKNFSTDDWTFHDNNATTSTYYYPVPKIFCGTDANTDVIFTTSTSKVSVSSDMRLYPSQKLVKITLQNYLPISWNSSLNSGAGGNVINTNYINIYPNILLDTFKDSILNGNGQYIIFGQKLKQPTKTSTQIDRETYTAKKQEDPTYDADAGYNQDVLAIAWKGEYNFHPGFNYEFRIKSETGDSFEFDTKLEANTDIYITWSAKTFEVNFQKYDSGNNNYIKESYTDSIEYTLNPNATKEIGLDNFNAVGKTIYGYSTVPLYKIDTTTGAELTDDEWATLWNNADCKTVFSRNQLYDSGLNLYFMYVPKKITITLSGGSVATGLGVAKGIFGSLGETYVINTTHGTATDLPIPTLNSATVSGDYAFSGYYFGSDCVAGVDAIYTQDNGTKYVLYAYTGELTGISLEANWTKIKKNVIYYSIDKNNKEIKLRDAIEVEFNQEIPEDYRAKEDTLARLEISYKTVDSSLDPAGFEFGGVYLDKLYKNLFDYETKILEDTNLYIKWNIKSFDLILDACIGDKPNGTKREGGWGNSSDKNTQTLSVPYNENLLTYLKNWKDTKPTESAISVTGFMPVTNNESGYTWAIKSVSMGDSVGAEDLLRNKFTTMPARSLTLYLIWQRQDGKLILNSTSDGYFEINNNIYSQVGGSGEYKISFESNLKAKLETMTNIPIPTYKKKSIDDPLQVFRYWTLDPNSAEPIPDDELMSMETQIYAVYAIQRTIKFYVLGATDDNFIGEIKVFEGEPLGANNVELNSILTKLDNMLSDDSGKSSFELDYWVGMQYDDKYSITELGEFNLGSTPITGNINLLAKLKPNENYVPPVKDTTNYIIVAGVVIVVALVLLFIVLVARPAKVQLSSSGKSKNKDIQAKLDEIRELERRRRDIDDSLD